MLRIMRKWQAGSGSGSGLQLYSGKAKLNAGAYSRRLAMLWAFSMIWLVLFIVVLINYNRMPMWAIACAVVGLFVAGPDVAVLFRSYSGYLEEWERDNEASGQG